MITPSQASAIAELSDETRRLFAELLTPGRHEGCGCEEGCRQAAERRRVARHLLEQPAATPTLWLVLWDYGQEGDSVHAVFPDEEAARQCIFLLRSTGYHCTALSLQGWCADDLALDERFPEVDAPYQRAPHGPNPAVRTMLELALTDADPEKVVATFLGKPLRVADLGTSIGDGALLALCPHCSDPLCDDRCKEIR